MSSVPAHTPAGRPAIAAELATRVVLAAGAAALLAVACLLIAELPAGPSIPYVLAGGIAMLLVLALAVARYDAAVALGLCLLPVVKFEPAPSDAVFAIVIVVAVVTGRFDLRRVPLTVTSCVGLLIALNVLSTIEAVDLAWAGRFFAITLYLAIFALWIAGYVDSPRKARVLVIVYLGGAVLSAIAGAAALNLPLPGRDFLIADGATRASALFKDPNVYGPFLIPIAAILLEERFRPRLLRLRGATAWVLLGILAVGVLFSYSRAAWANFAMAMTITVVVLSLRRGGARRAVKAVMGLLVALALVAAVIGASGSVGFIQERAQRQGYDTERFGAQRAGLELVQQYPAGVGPGQFSFHHNVETHSTYVRVLTEQGYLGLATWIVLVLTTLVLALRNAILARDTWGIGSAALLGSWCGLLFNSAVVDTLHWRHLWLVAALIWAASMRPARRQSNTPAGSAARVLAPA